MLVLCVLSTVRGEAAPAQASKVLGIMTDIMPGLKATVVRLLRMKFPIASLQPTSRLHTHAW